jgi:hypothetical protein
MCTVLHCSTVHCTSKQCLRSLLPYVSSKSAESSKTIRSTIGDRLEAVTGGCSTYACTGTWTATISALPLIYAMLTATGINGLLGIGEIGVRLR